MKQVVPLLDQWLWIFVLVGRIALQCIGNRDIQAWKSSGTILQYTNGYNRKMWAVQREANKPRKDAECAFATAESSGQCINFQSFIRQERKALTWQKVFYMSCLRYTFLAHWLPISLSFCILKHATNMHFIWRFAVTRERFHSELDREPT